MNSRVVSIAGRELGAYFSSPIAYIVMTAFLAPVGAYFFWDFFYLNQAEMRKFFQILPLAFTFFVPAVTMRLFAEERKTGSLEMLLTLPLSTTELVIGKFLSALIFIAVMLLPTLFYLFIILWFGSPDMGPVLGGYIGILFLAASYAGIGVLASAVTGNQIVAFIVTWLITFSLWLVDKITIFLPGSLKTIGTLGADYHFAAVSRGIIDSRDIIYFIVITVLSLLAAVKVLDKRR